MRDTEKINFETLLERLGGCGLFQAFLVLSLISSQFGLSSNLYFMTYGLYNPGWRCLDNLTTSESGPTSPTTTNTSDLYVKFSCVGFDTCSNLEFSPEASTIVTEWGLACGRAWVPRVMIVSSAIGSLCMNPFSGFLADRYGRKRVLQVAFSCLSILHMTSAFLDSWKVYMAVRFFIGMASVVSLINCALVTEYVTPKWRIYISSLPSWCFAITIISIVAMVTKSWRVLHIYISVLFFFAFVFLWFVPESMRWLIVHSKGDEEIEKVVKKIARLNRKDIPEKEFMEKILEKGRVEKNNSLSFKEMLTIFKKGYGLITISICTIFASIELVYFAIAFGISALPGNMFENMIIMAVTELPANALAIFCGNHFGRIKSLFVFALVKSVILFGVSFLDAFGQGGVKVVGILVMAAIAKDICSALFYVLDTTMFEVYPTVIRTTTIGFICIFNIIGQLSAPFIMPDDPETLYVNYAAMGGVMLVCCLLVCLIPETKGKQLENTLVNETAFDEGDKISRLSHDFGE